LPGEAQEVKRLPTLTSNGKSGKSDATPMGKEVKRFHCGAAPYFLLKKAGSLAVGEQHGKERLVRGDSRL